MTHVCDLVETYVVWYGPRHHDRNQSNAGYNSNLRPAKENERNETVLTTKRGVQVLHVTDDKA